MKTENHKDVVFLGAAPDGYAGALAKEMSKDGNSLHIGDIKPEDIRSFSDKINAQLIEHSTLINPDDKNITTENIMGVTKELKPKLQEKPTIIQAQAGGFISNDPEEKREAFSRMLLQKSIDNLPTSMMDRARKIFVDSHGQWMDAFKEMNIDPKFVGFSYKEKKGFPNYPIKLKEEQEELYAQKATKGFDTLIIRLTEAMTGSTKMSPFLPLILLAKYNLARQQYGENISEETKNILDSVDEKMLNNYPKNVLNEGILLLESSTPEQISDINEEFNTYLKKNRKAIGKMKEDAKTVTEEFVLPQSAAILRHIIDRQNDFEPGTILDISWDNLFADMNEEQETYTKIS